MVLDWVNRLPDPRYSNPQSVTIATVARNGQKPGFLEKPGFSGIAFTIALLKNL
ncbi:MAG: hypothetical protein F6J93_08990 [Oscillatoria sp. SIO1A7]|nr:hypothetical protein [Oscillatoria sp. SIO1A7]